MYECKSLSFLCLILTASTNILFRANARAVQSVAKSSLGSMTIRALSSAFAARSAASYSFPSAAAVYDLAVEDAT